MSWLKIANARGKLAPKTSGLRGPRRGRLLANVKLTSEQHTFFHERGHLRLERAIARERLRSLQTQISSSLTRHGINQSGRGIPRSISDLPVFQQVTKLSQLATVAELDTQIISTDITRTIEALAKTRVTSRQSQLLLSPPKQGDWSLDNLNWHTDVSSPRGASIPGIQAFVIVQDLANHGGATLVLSGSHLHSGPEASARVRQALRKGREGEAALRELNLSIAEFSGKAGDVYLMDMRLLHTPSINTRNQLRMVVTVRFFLA